MFCRINVSQIVAGRADEIFVQFSYFGQNNRCLQNVMRMTMAPIAMHERYRLDGSMSGSKNNHPDESPVQAPPYTRHGLPTAQVSGEYIKYTELTRNA